MKKADKTRPVSHTALKQCVAFGVIYIIHRYILYKILTMHKLFASLYPVAGKGSHVIGQMSFVHSVLKGSVRPNCSSCVQSQ